MRRAKQQRLPRNGRPRAADLQHRLHRAAKQPFLAHCRNDANAQKLHPKPHAVPGHRHLRPACRQKAEQQTGRNGNGHKNRQQQRHTSAQGQPLTPGRAAAAAKAASCVHSQPQRQRRVQDHRAVMHRQRHPHRAFKACAGMPQLHGKAQQAAHQYGINFERDHRHHSAIHGAACIQLYFSACRHAALLTVRYAARAQKPAKGHSCVGSCSCS